MVSLSRVMDRRWRVWLPASATLINCALLIWDIHNVHVIESMGMAWDTGAPFWPYQAAGYFLAVLNVPARAATLAVSYPLQLRTALPVDIETLLFAVPLWWCIGRRLDYGLVPAWMHRRATLWAVLLTTIAIALLWLTVSEALQTCRWWFEWEVSPGILLRTFIPYCWGFFIAFAATISAYRLIRPLLAPNH